VVEPAAITRAEARGLPRLYVALTRAVSRLTVLHTEPLPAELANPARPAELADPTRPAELANPTRPAELADPAD
jgi:hypothetical protein